MKAIRFVIPKTSGNSFRLQLDQSKRFYDSIHYHPEHQLTTIIEGEGTCFIGNHVERFSPGSVYLIGKNVPHVFKSDQAYYDPDNQLTSFGISIFFKEETFGSQFFEIPEMTHIKRLLNLALNGLKLKGEERVEISENIVKTQRLEGFERFQHLLNILNIFAVSESLHSLSTVSYNSPIKDSDNERINIVFHYLSTHFQKDISLEEIASVANMTPNAFCRYFKQRTRKPFSSFLNEMRVEYAGKLIADTKQNFGNIAFESGYNSISYFNRQFKRITGCTPIEYRTKFGK